MLEQFRARLVMPYLTTLRLFDPVNGSGSPAVRRVLADVTDRVVVERSRTEREFSEARDMDSPAVARVVAEESCP